MFNLTEITGMPSEARSFLPLSALAGASAQGMREGQKAGTEMPRARDTSWIRLADVHHDTIKAGEGAERQGSSCPPVNSQLVQCREGCANFSNMGMCVFKESAFPLPGVYPEKDSHVLMRKLAKTRVFIAAPFEIEKKPTKSFCGGGGEKSPLLH